MISLGLEMAYCVDNGFTSYDEMQVEQAPLMGEVLNALGAVHPKNRRPLLVDLGCGNGALMRDLAIKRPDAQYRGIDLSAEKVVRGNRELRMKDVALNNGDIWQVERTAVLQQQVDIVLVMVGFLLQGPNRELKRWLRQYGINILAYSYSDDLERFKEDIDRSEAQGVTLVRRDCAFEGANTCVWNATL